MLYVLLILVVTLAFVSGFEYAALRVARAERRAEVAELKNANLTIAEKCRMLCKQNEELEKQLALLENMGGVN